MNIGMLIPLVLPGILVILVIPKIVFNEINTDNKKQQLDVWYLFNSYLLIGFSLFVAIFGLFINVGMAVIAILVLCLFAYVVYYLVKENHTVGIILSELNNIVVFSFILFYFSKSFLPLIIFIVFYSISKVVMYYLTNKTIMKKHSLLIFGYLYCCLMSVLITSIKSRSDNIFEFINWYFDEISEVLMPFIYTNIMFIISVSILWIYYVERIKDKYKSLDKIYNVEDRKRIFNVVAKIFYLIIILTTILFNAQTIKFGSEVKQMIMPGASILTIIALEIHWATMKRKMKDN